MKSSENFDINNIMKNTINNNEINEKKIKI